MQTKTNIKVVGVVSFLRRLEVLRLFHSMVIVCVIISSGCQNNNITRNRYRTTHSVDNYIIEIVDAYGVSHEYVAHYKYQGEDERIVGAVLGDNPETILLRLYLSNKALESARSDGIDSPFFAGDKMEFDLASSSLRTSESSVFLPKYDKTRVVWKAWTRDSYNLWIYRLSEQYNIMKGFHQGTTIIEENRPLK